MASDRHPDKLTEWFLVLHFAAKNLNQKNFVGENYFYNAWSKGRAAKKQIWFTYIIQFN